MALRVSLSDKHSLIVFLIATGGILACGCAYVAYLSIGHWLRTKTGRSWPSAEATVQLAEVASSFDNAEPDEAPSASVFGDRGASISSANRYSTLTWMVRVTYSFSVGGAYYGGYSYRGVSSQEAGDEYAQGLPGKKFPVRYKPRNPEKSIVLDDEWAAAIPSSSGSDGARDPCQ